MRRLLRVVVAMTCCAAPGCAPGSCGGGAPKKGTRPSSLDLTVKAYSIPSDPALKDLGKPADPPEVAKAVAHRELEPRVALSMLRDTWKEAVARKDLEVAAYALDRSGDVLMDLRDSLDGGEARLAELDGTNGVSPLLDACTAAHDDYLRAWTLAEFVGDRRLLGRIAHDIGWALERCNGGGSEAVHWYETALVYRLAVHDAGGVRFTANNLGRLQARPKWRRLELYKLAAEGARVAKDWGGMRKIEGNIARLWFYSADTSWTSPDAGTETGENDDYAAVPLEGGVREEFLTHLTRALEAAKNAGESSRTVCEGMQLYAGPPCDDWGDLPAEKLFPEGCCGPGE